jgi:hypothetical protein
MPAIRAFLDLAMEVIQSNIPRPAFHASLKRRRRE